MIQFRREFWRSCASCKWSDPLRNALAASIFALSCQKSSTSAKRDTTLGIASFEKFRQMSSHQRQFVCRRLLASGQSMHQFQNSFLSRQPSRIVPTEGKPFVLFSEYGLIAFVSNSYLPTFFSATESKVFVVSAKDTHICSDKAIHRHYAKLAPHLIAFIAWLLIDS